MSGIPLEEKKRRLQEMPEQDFRSNIVLPLMRRLGYQQVTDIHGADECGVDGFFTETDKIERKRLIAIQTKRGTINMTSKAAQNVTTILTQLRTALEVKIPLLPAKAMCIPDQVWCIISGSINRKATEHIISELNRDSRITFLDGAEIINLIEVHCPELWDGIPADVSLYYSGIKKKIEQTDSPDILSLHAGAAHFIESTLYCYHAIVKKVRGIREARRERKEYNIAELVDTLVIKRTPSLIVAEAGMGKSTLLWRLAYVAIEHYKQKNIMPIVLPAREGVECADATAFWQRCAQTICSVSGPSALRTNSVTAENIILLIDGLDEIGDTKQQTLCINNILQWSKEKNAALCCTSRTNPKTPAFRQVYYIAPLLMAQAQKLLSKTIKNRKISAHDMPLIEEAALSGLEYMNAHYGFGLTPLLVRVYATVIEIDKSDIPANITILFEKYTELLLGRWDRGKGISQQFAPSLKAFLLAEIALDMHERDEQDERRRQQLSEQDFRTKVAHIIAERGYGSNTQQLYEEIVQSRLVVCKEGNIQFSHLLLQEFFASKAIPNQRYIKQKIKKYHWSNPIIFYFGANAKDAALLKNFLPSKIANNPFKSMPSLRTVGMSLQACYLAKAQERLEVWNTLIDILAQHTHTFRRVVGNELFPISGWFSYYQFMKDAVPLSLLRNNTLRMKLCNTWKRQTDSDTGDYTEERWFWRLTALLENRQLDQIAQEKMYRNIETDDFLVAFHFHIWEKTHIWKKTHVYSDNISVMLKKFTDHIQHYVSDEYPKQYAIEVHKQLSPTPSNSDG